MLAHACRGRERIAVRRAIAAAAVREIEREGFAEEAVLDRLGVGVGCVEAPRRGRRIILGDLELGRVRLGFDAVLAQQQVAESRWRAGPGSSGFAGSRVGDRSAERRGGKEWVRTCSY